MLDEIPRYTASGCDSDFSGVQRKAPALIRRVVAPGSVAAAMREARRHRLPVGLRGAGHSCGGQTACSGGLRIEGYADVASWRPLDEQRIVVRCNSSWRALERELNAAGRACPVVTDFLGLSVGGTLAVGGFGACSAVAGAQIDHVDRLQLVDAEGHTHTLTRDDDAFRFAIAAQGRLGMVEQVVMRTVPHRPVTVRHGHVLPDVSSMIALIEDIASGQHEPPGRFFCGAMFPGGVFAELGGSYPDAEQAKRASPCPWSKRLGDSPDTALIRDLRFADDLRVRQWVEAFGDCRRLWADYFVPVTHARELIEGVMRARPFVAGALRCLYVGLIAPPRSPAAAFDPRGDTTKFRVGVGLYCMVPRDRPRLIERVESVLADTLAHCIELSGRPYLHGRFAWTDALLRRCYGDELDRLAQHRETFDPQARIATGAWGRPHQKPPQDRTSQ